MKEIYTKTMETTAKEKARELVYEFLPIISDVNPLQDYFEAAKKCALVCVEKVLGVSYYKSIELAIDQVGDETFSEEYWEEVKQEIKKLKQ